MAVEASSWERALGSAWAELLRNLDIGPDDTLMEIGPGHGAKIGLALAQIGFRGELYLLEPNAIARQKTLDCYRKLLPAADIHALDTNVAECQVSWPQLDAILSNHIFDDLILSAAVPSSISDPLFSSMDFAAPCSRAFTDTWFRLLQSPAWLADCIDRVAAELTWLVQRSGAQAVAFNHYPSWRHHCAGLGGIHTVSRAALEALGCALGAEVSGDRQIPGYSEVADVVWLLA